MDKYIQLEREFSEISKSNVENEEDWAFQLGLGSSNVKKWEDLLQQYRVVILAEAGAGKTEELTRQAKALASEGKNSFFVRIEYMEFNLRKILEVGNERSFNRWLESDEEAWFFLDSVDEAKLKDAGAFAMALTHFANEIESAKDRAHIFVSSRPYSWYPNFDRDLMDEKLFLPKPNQDSDFPKTKQESALVVYQLLPLDEDRVRSFCQNREVSSIDQLITQIDKVDLWSLAERPFDLDVIVHKWKEDRNLGSRLELLRHNIDRRLNEVHSVIKSQKNPINLELARSGARRLAAAVVLTGISNIKVPDTTVEEVPGIDASIILADWESSQVITLLNRGIFNEILFSAVRFRHREVRELLAAEWFIDLLVKTNSRFAIESLFFKDSYGEPIVTPKLRPLLPWILLENQKIRERVIQYYPEIIAEGGDPSHLSLSERKSILLKLIDSIVNNHVFPPRDNVSIARVAKKDLSDEVLALIHQHQSNDDVIYYLAKLVWQGEMTSCIEALSKFAQDSSRPNHSRNAAVRAVMACGADTQKILFWQRLLDNKEILARELLAEMIYWAPANPVFIKLILNSFPKLPEHKKFKSTGLSAEIKRFISKCNESCTIEFIEGAYNLLNQAPYHPYIDCLISKNYAWLMSSLTVAVEKLIAANNSFSLDSRVLGILLKVPKLKFWSDGDYSDNKNKLHILVPEWPLLNDTLYWSAIEDAALGKKVDSLKGFPNDATLNGYEHYWKFDGQSIYRLLDQIKNRSSLEEKCIAISSVYRFIYMQGNKESLLDGLTSIAEAEPILTDYLSNLLNPQLTEEEIENNKVSALRASIRQQRKEKREAELQDEINRIKANPNDVISSLGSDKNSFSPVLSHLYQAVIAANTNSNFYEGANWKNLIGEYGNEVAEAYRDAARLLWRNYIPTLQSEGSERDNTIPYEVILSLAGIRIDIEEDKNFIEQLTSVEVSQLLRFLTWGPSSLSLWFEQIYACHPAESLDAVIKELLWELENVKVANGLPYILSKIVYNAPFIHADIAPFIYDWATKNSAQLNIHRKHCVRILINGAYDKARIIGLAMHQVQVANDSDYIAWWYAILIDLDPGQGIESFSSWLESLSKEAASRAAQYCVVSLVGGDSFNESGPYFGHYKTPEYLKLLYLLITRYIPFDEYKSGLEPEDYLGGLPGEAEDAKSQIYRALIDIPGKAAYLAIREIASETHDDSKRDILRNAYDRAVEDGDIHWSEEQVLQFESSLNITPKTHRQLYELTLRRLIELKNDLERSNDSPWQTWQRAQSETEMSQLIVKWLNDHCSKQYVTAKEPELANDQRMDIWIQNTYAKPPVPIELKLLDQDWSGNALCERLRNQLAGDYLREEGATCGVLLLVSKSLPSSRKWDIDGNWVTLSDLGNALKEYWKGIQHIFPAVDEIEVVVIDLNVRGEKSKI